MKKSKPKIGRLKPYACVNHPKRLAIVKRVEVDMCWVCWYDSLLEVIRDAFQRMMIVRRRKWWIKKYGESE